MSSADLCYRYKKTPETETSKTETTRPGTSKNPSVEVTVLKPGKHNCINCGIYVLHPVPFLVNPQVGWVCKVCRKYPKHTRDGSYVSVPVFFNLFRERVPAIYFPCKECDIFFEKKSQWVECCSLECEGVACKRHLECGRKAWGQAKTPSRPRGERINPS
jgi:hypothetical protein